MSISDLINSVRETTSRALSSLYENLSHKKTMLYISAVVAAVAVGSANAGNNSVDERVVKLASSKTATKSQVLTDLPGTPVWESQINFMVMDGGISYSDFYKIAVHTNSNSGTDPNDTPDIPIQPGKSLDAYGETTNGMFVLKNAYGTNDLRHFKVLIEYNGGLSKTNNVQADVVIGLPSGSWAMNVNNGLEFAITNKGTYNLGTNVTSVNIFEQPEITNSSVKANSQNPGNLDLTAGVRYYGPARLALDTATNLLGTVIWNEKASKGTVDGQNSYSLTASNLTGNAQFGRIKAYQK